MKQDRKLEVGQTVFYPATVVRLEETETIVGINCGEDTWFKLPEGYRATLPEILETFPEDEVWSAINDWRRYRCKICGKKDGDMITKEATVLIHAKDCYGNPTGINP